MLFSHEPPVALSAGVSTREDLRCLQGVSPESYSCDRVAVALSKIVERTEAFARSRGEILGALGCATDPAREVALSTQLDTLDRNFLNYLRQRGELLRSNVAFLHDLAEKARSAQDLTRFEQLREQFYQLGINLGEAQGREIDSERDTRIRTFVQKLKVQVSEGFCDLEPPKATGTPYITTIQQKLVGLHDALQAALSLGEQEGIASRLGAEIAATRIYRAIGGWKEYVPLSILKDFATVQNTLQGLSKAEIGFIESAFEERAGRPLHEALFLAYGKKNGAHAYRLLQGDTVNSAAFAVLKELNSHFTTNSLRGTALRRIYEKLSPTEIAGVELVVSRSQAIEPKEVAAYIAKKVPDHTARELQALREGDAIREKALRVKELLSSWWFKRPDVRKVMRALTPEEVPLIAARYEREYGVSLRVALEERLPRCPARDLCLAVLDRDAVRLAAAKLACALEYRADYIGAPFLNTTPKERDFLISSFNLVYHGDGKGDFWKDLKKAVWREDYYGLSAFPSVCKVLEHLWWPCMNSYPFIESIINHGNLTPAELLRYFMVGVGTDLEGIMAVLSNRTRESILEIEQDYARRYPPSWLSRLAGRIPVLRSFVLLGDLRHDLGVELSGDSEFDVGILLEGLPHNPTDTELCRRVFNRLQRRYNHEQSGLLLKRARLSVLKGDYRVLKRFEDDFLAASNYFEEFIGDRDALSHEHVKRFLTLARIAEIQADAYRLTKISLGALALNSGAFIGASLGAAAVLALSSVSYPALALAAFTGSLTWRLLNGRFILGNGFGRSDLIFQSVRALVDGASMFSVRLGMMTLSRFVGVQISKGAAKTGFKTGLHRFVQSVEARIRRQDKSRHVLGSNASLRSPNDLSSVIDEFRAQLLNPGTKVWSLDNDRGSPIEDLFIRALMAEGGERQHWWGAQHRER